MSIRPIIGKPRLTQDWDSEQHERETHWTSLFYDLLIVSALNAIAEPFEEMEDGELVSMRDIWFNALLQFAAVVSSWNCLSHFTSFFEDESMVGHLCFYVHCFGMAATTAGCVGDLRDNYKVLAIGMILARIGLLVLYFRPLVWIPRARADVVHKCVPFLVGIAIILCGLLLTRNTPISTAGEQSEENQEDTDVAFAKFRIVLVVAIIWDWLAPVYGWLATTKEQRIPLHILSYSGRVREMTMVIFGEAIFAIVLQPYSSAKRETWFYMALGMTLWLIYSMALQEFNIAPSEEDHAMRRSIFFGFSWHYSQIAKQICLLGTSIGIKRAHLLTFEAPMEPMDTETRNAIVWGLSSTMFCIVMIRSYSFGWGRHPDEHDSHELYWVKFTWWTVLGFSCLWPQLIDRILIDFFPRPLMVLTIFAVMMAIIIVLEAGFSNIVARRLVKAIAEEAGEEAVPVDELTYLVHSKPVGGASHGS